MTSIEWTRGDDGSMGETWNPVVGCSRVSEGCRNCYAERQSFRNAAMGWDRYQGLTKKVGGEIRWTGTVRLVPEVLDKPLRWKKPRRVFVNSMSDLFHESLPDHAIAQVFAVMEGASRHTFQILTKRPARMLAWVSEWKRKIDYMRDRPEDRGYDERYRHVWLGVSVENREQLQRIDHLKDTPAAVRFVSFEPLLEDLGALMLDGIHWAIWGGESGPGARPLDVAWIRSGLRQCREQSVAPFVKQLGAAPYDSEGDWSTPIARWHGKRGDPGRRLVEHLRDRKGGDPEEWEPGLRVREFPA